MSNPPNPTRVSTAPVMPTPPVQGRPPAQAPVAPAPTPPAPAAPAAPAPGTPPAPGTGAAPQSIHQIVHNGRTVDVPDADHTRYAQIGYDQENNAAKKEIRERLGAKAARWDALQGDMSRLPPAAKAVVLEAFKTGAVPTAAAPVAPVLDAEGEPDPAATAQQARMAAMESKLEQMTAQLGQSQQNQLDLERDTRVATALGRYENFQAAEDNSIAGLLANALTLAQPNMTPEDAAAHAHNELMGFAQRRAQATVETRVDQQQLAVVPPGAGTPQLNQLEKPKPTMEDLKSGKIRQWAAELAEKSGVRELMRGGAQPPPQQ